MNTWILLPVLLPAVAGVALLAASFREHLAMGRPGKTDGELSTRMGQKMAYHHCGGARAHDGARASCCMEW